MSISNGDYFHVKSGLQQFAPIEDADLPATIARDSEVTSAVAALSSVYQPLSTTLNKRIVRVVIDGAGSAITTGAKKVYVTVPYTGTITSWQILADVSGSIVLDVWKDTYANYPPTVADTITASAKPTLTTATKATSSTLTGWTTSVTAGDIIEVNVDSATTVTKAYLDLFVTVT